MNENMVDVLIYLYEHYMDGEQQPPVAQSDLEDELSQAGFSQSEIDKALHWLDELALGVEAAHEHAPLSESIRFTASKNAKSSILKHAVCSCH